MSLMRSMCLLLLDSRMSHIMEHTINARFPEALKFLGFPALDLIRGVDRVAFEQVREYYLPSEMKCCFALLRTFGMFYFRGTCWV